VTRVILGELVKLRTTRTVWFAAAGALAATLVALAWNCWQASIYLQPFDRYLAQMVRRPKEDIPADTLTRLHALWQAQHDPDRIAANLVTSGQYLGALLVCLLAVLLVTGEYRHRTATATFLATPNRTLVIVAKLVTAVLVAGMFWALSLVLDLAVAAVFLTTAGHGDHLVGADAIRSILLNLAVYVVWAVFGVGIGALIVRQVGAALLVAVLYLPATAAVGLAFQLIHDTLIPADWVLGLQVALPVIASQIMVTPGEAFAGAPPQWVGAVVLLSYGLLGAIVGVFRERRRDIA
jgi:hypothetical protein